MINVIGAGPAGLFSACSLARLGHRVTVYDVKRHIGLPVHCTGIVTRELEEVLPLKRPLIANRFRKIRVHSAHNFIEMRSTDLLLDRKAFDLHLAGMAESEGATINMSSKGRESSTTIYADGPSSQGRKLLNPNAIVQYYIGRQAICRGSFEKGTYEVYLGSIAPEFFAWAVPENEETARIGIACKRDTDAHFRRFIGKLKVKQIEQQGGIIPIYSRIATQKGNRYLVGDAACQVKATTGGGLVPGLKSAQILAECIHGKSNYHASWRREFANELSLHLHMRRTLDTLTDRQYDRLLEILKGNKALEMSRDRPVSQAISLLKSPRLLAFGLSALAQRLYARPSQALSET